MWELADTRMSVGGPAALRSSPHPLHRLSSADKYSLGPRILDLSSYIFTSNMQTLYLFALINFIGPIKLHTPSPQLLCPWASDQETLFRWQKPDVPWSEEPSGRSRTSPPLLFLLDRAADLPSKVESERKRLYPWS